MLDKNNLTQKEKEKNDVFTRNQEFGGVGENIAPIDEPEKADDSLFKGFKSEEDVK